MYLWGDPEIPVFYDFMNYSLLCGLPALGKALKGLIAPFHPELSEIIQLALAQFHVEKEISQNTLI